MALSRLRATHQLLDRLQVKNYCKTSGKSGIHVLVPLGDGHTFAEVRRFGKLLAERVAADIPNLATTQHRIGKRRGRVYLDYMRNAIGQTAAAPYSLRPSPGALVSAPLEWHEVRKGLRPDQFTIKTIFKRLKAKGDMLRPMLKQRTDLSRAVRKLERESLEASAGR
ncbi:hypothetical protein MTX20_35820 [Bradyrhizobium sp. ISRA435]|nr:hypothetical protein MTX20_35820 [Bradyrhizobium sp. ISRA435]